MQHTQNYQLSRWEKDDRIMMEDFNADNEKIDAALKANADATATGLRAEADARAAADSTASELLTTLHQTVTKSKLCRIKYGSYTGNGKYGSGNPNSLTFDFVPVVVIVGCDSFSRYQAWPTVAIRGAAGMHCDNATGMTTQCYVTWTGSGLSWYNSDCASDQNNNSGSIYYYVALGYSA